MRRYLWGSIACAATALLLLSAFTVHQLSRGLAGAERASREHMRALAEYIVDHMRADLFSYSFVLTPQSLPADFLKEKSAWISRLALAAGLQRVALTDSNGVVYISNAASLRPGANIRPTVLDSAGFDAARRTRAAVFSRAAGMGSGQWLYYPVDFFGTRHVVVLETDRNLIGQFESFRRFTYALAGAVLLALAALIGAVFALDSRARAALDAARQNEQLAFLGRTSAELAHELKNPLAIVKSSADVLRKRFDPEGRDEAFRFLSEETMRLARIITGILGFSGTRPMATRPVLVSGLIDGAAAAFHAAHAGVEIEAHVPAAFVSADPDVARHVLENLFANAAQAMGDKGRILIRAESGSGRIRLWVADTGPGVSKALRRNLFDPFVTGTRTGSGLGLAIVKSLCERMGWKITLETGRQAQKIFGGSDFGACFALDIPVAGANL